MNIPADDGFIQGLFKIVAVGARVGDEDLKPCFLERRQVGDLAESGNVDPGLVEPLELFRIGRRRSPRHHGEITRGHALGLEGLLRLPRPGDEAEHRS